MIIDLYISSGTAVSYGSTIKGTILYSTNEFVLVQQFSNDLIIKIPKKTSLIFIKTQHSHETFIEVNGNRC